MRALSIFVAICLTALGIAACDKGIPTAPEGTTLVITASPLVITPTGTSIVTVTAVRSGGQPVNPGTEIRLDTTLGTIDPIATTDERGMARAVLRGTGVGGEATVTARSGVAEPVTVEVNIGAEVVRITLVATPATIPAGEAAHVELLAVVRDNQGQPVEGANVVFTTTAGRLTSQGAIVITNARGEARDTLNASADAVAAAGSGIAVTAQAAGGGGNVAATTNILIRGTTAAICSDNVDNDGDGFVDFGDDEGCSSAADTNELAQCQNGIDDDFDGDTDGADAECTPIVVQDNDESA